MNNKKLSLKISQYSQDVVIFSMCLSLFLIKLQVFRSATLLKRDSNAGVFLTRVFFFLIFKNAYFEKSLWTTACG